MGAVVGKLYGGISTFYRVMMSLARRSHSDVWLGGWESRVEWGDYVGQRFGKEVRWVERGGGRMEGERKGGREKRRCVVPDVWVWKKGIVMHLI